MADKSVFELDDKEFISVPVASYQLAVYTGLAVKVKGLKVLDRPTASVVVVPVAPLVCPSKVSAELTVPEVRYILKEVPTSVPETMVPVAPPENTKSSPSVNTGPEE